MEKYNVIVIVFSQIGVCVFVYYFFKRSLNFFVNQLESKFEIMRNLRVRYTDEQFILYQKLWISLCDLKQLSDDLWEKATSIKLGKFSKQLKVTKNEIERAALFIEDTHYRKLMKIIEQFSKYRIGKQCLIHYRNVNRNRDYCESDVHQMIENNRDTKRNFEELIAEVIKNLRRQIGGNL
jgi:hypothetical protein